MPVGEDTARRLTEADKNYMLSARGEGRSYKFIAGVLGVSSETIMHHLCAKRRSKKAVRNKAYKALHGQEQMKRLEEEHPNYRRDIRRVKELSTNGGKVQGLNKRPYPKDQKCELCCNEAALLKYHHWDPANLSIGMWLCEKCHRVAEVLELTDLSLLESKYLALKKKAKSEVIAARLEAKMEGLRGA